MGLPKAGGQVHFNVADEGRIGLELDHGAVEIGSGLAIAEAGVKNTDRASVQGVQLVAFESLVLPNGHQEDFGGGVGCGSFAEAGGGTGQGTPVRIRNGQQRVHVVS